MAGLPVNWSDPEVRAAMKQMGRRGGQSRSDAKRAAVKENLKKALAKRQEMRRQGQR